MNYPFWEIPYLGSGWVIGIIAIFHVMISQFAVGGGLYLPMAERKAMRMPEGQLRTDWLNQLASHSKFFLILTAVFGTVSGVGIWFAIGLTHPEATSTLIHNFVFGWAMEWVFFLVELTTIAVYYSTWSKIDPKLHLTVGWVYAVASVFTLIIINGILTFMLTPGDTWLAVAGTGHEASKFWYAFFNPTYWPSLFLRACVCCALAGIWALITASRIDGDKHPALKTSHGPVERQVAGALFRGHALPSDLVPLDGSGVAAGFASHWASTPSVPAPSRSSPASPCSSSSPRPPSSASPTSSPIAIRATSISPTPWPCCCWRSSPPAPASTPARCCASPTSSAAGCTPTACAFPMLAASIRKATWPTQIGSADNSNSSYSRGEAIFRGECGSCHTLNGYRPLKTLLAGRDRANIASFITMLHDHKPDSPYPRFMPPMVGTKQDIDDLADFLNAQVNPPAPAAQKPVQTARK